LAHHWVDSGQTGNYPETGFAEIDGSSPTSQLLARNNLRFAVIRPECDVPQICRSEASAVWGNNSIGRVKSHTHGMGAPVGSDIEYTDEITMPKGMEGRLEL